jgi:hypothetical protein
MKFYLRDVRAIIREALLEQEEKKKEAKKEFVSPFVCPRHHLPLDPVWTRSETQVVGASRKPTVGPMLPGQSRFVKPPTSIETPAGKKTEQGSRIKAWQCPLWKNDGPYVVGEKGHECDYRVTGTMTFPGQVSKHVALGTVAEEEGVLFKPIEPKNSKNDMGTLMAMIKNMEEEGFGWKRVPAEPSSKPTGKWDVTAQKKKDAPAFSRGKDKWMKVKRKPKTFTSDDIAYLAGVYPAELSRAAEAEGYAGPKPYFLGGKGEAGAHLFRILQKAGWELATPEKPTTVKVTKGRDEPLLDKGAFDWVHDGDDLDDDDPWDEDTDVDEKGDDDDDVFPDRWKF